MAARPPWTWCRASRGMMARAVIVEDDPLLRAELRDQFNWDGTAMLLHLTEEPGSLPVREAYSRQFRQM